MIFFVKKENILVLGYEFFFLLSWLTINCIAIFTLDGDDLTSRMSETKPNTIIIKTEKKEATPIKTTTDSVKSPVKDDGEIMLIEKEKTVPSQETPTDIELKPDKDKVMDVAEVVVKKELSSAPEEEVTPMEVDDSKPEISSVGKAADSMPKSDIEMADAELVTDIKDSQLLPAKIDLGKSSQSDSKAINKHLTTPTDNSSIAESLPTVEQCPSKDPLVEPSTEKASPLVTKEMSSKDAKDDSILPANVASSGEEVEAKYKGGKIKLYEKWSNEKKQAAAAADAKQSLKEKEVTHSQQQGSQKGIDHSSSGASSKSKSSILPSSTSKVEEAPMDLSVSFRSDDVASKGKDEILPSDLTTSKKGPVQDQSRTGRNHVNTGEKHPLQLSPEKKHSNNASEAPRPFKKKHLSMAMEETTSDLNRKSVIFEVKSNKLLNQFQESSGNSIVKDKVPTTSGFSHLQALQNMCNDNPMTCFQSSVIRSASPDKRLKSDSGLPNFSQNSSEKSSYNEANCDNISQKYKFSSSQLSGDVKHFSESDVPPLLLKSNVHSSSDISSKETAPPQEKPSSALKSSMSEAHDSSSKNTLPSVSENLSIQLKDTDCPERIATSVKHSPPKARSEKVSMFKKHPRTNDHSVASIMDYKDVTKSNLNESPTNCDNLKSISGESLKNSTQTTDGDNIIATDKTSLKYFNKKSETLSPKIVSSQDIHETATNVDKNVDLVTISTRLEGSGVASISVSKENTTTKVESSIPIGAELKSTKIISNEEDIPCNLNKTDIDNSVKSNTSDKKFESKSVSLENQSSEACAAVENKMLNCEKSEKDKQSSTYEESKNSKTVTTEVVSSNLVKEQAAIDIPITVTPISIKSIEGSAESTKTLETDSKDTHISAESRTVKGGVTTSNKIKDTLSEPKSEQSLEMKSIITESAAIKEGINRKDLEITMESKTEQSVTASNEISDTLHKPKSEHSLEIKSTTTDSETCTKVSGSTSQVAESTNEKPSSVPESSLTPAEPSKSIKESEKKFNDKHSIVSIIDKKESENKLSTSGELDHKEPTKCLPTETSSTKVESSNDQKDLSSKIEISTMTKNEPCESEFAPLVKDKIPVEEKCVPIEETNSSVKIDIDEGTEKQNLTKDNEKHSDSTKMDLSPGKSDTVSDSPTKETCTKSESEIVSEDVPKKLTTSKTLTVNEEVIDSKPKTQDMISPTVNNKKELISDESTEIVKDSQMETISESIKSSATALDENESPTTELSKEKSEVSLQKCNESTHSETSSDKKDVEKPLELSETKVDKEESMVLESCIKEVEKAQVLKEGGKKKTGDAEETVDKEDDSSTTKHSVEAEDETVTSKELVAKSEESSEVILKETGDNIEKVDSIKTHKESKKKLSQSASKPKEQETSPESLKKLEKQDNSKHSKSSRRDKKHGDLKKSVSNDTTIEDKCTDFLIDEEKEKEPIPKEKLETIPKKKSELGLKTKIKINIKDPLAVYFSLHNSCLESKMRHPSFEKPKKILPPTTTLNSKPKLITSFSMDTTDDIHVIQTVIDTSPTKKKRGRLRQTTPNSKSPQNKAAKENSKPSPKTSRKATVDEEKDGFHIPEGFLEILSNTKSDGSSAKKEPPPRKPRGRKLKISAPSMENSESESTPIKRSRRIQNIQQKKMSELAVEMEREQRILEQLAKKSVQKDVTQKSPVKV